jgi:hypothetical protein
MTLDDLIGVIAHVAPGPDAPPSSRRSYGVAAVDRVRVIAALRVPPTHRRAVDRTLVAVRRRLVAEIDIGGTPEGVDLQTALTAGLTAPPARLPITVLYRTAIPIGAQG